MTNRLKISIVFFLFVALFVAGCASGGSDNALSEAPAEEAMAPMPTQPAPGNYEYEESTAAEAAPERRVIIYNGTISLVVVDTEETAQAVADLAEAVGGYVAESNLYQSGEAMRGQVTIRVPADQFQAVLADLRALALRVESESANSEDVTREFIDLEARLNNLRATEAALQQLLEERQRLGTTSDILEVYRELTSIRGQIEQVEGQLRYLQNQAAFSTLTVEITPDALYQPIQVGGWQPTGVAKQALRALISALQGLINLLIWIVILVLPLLVVIFGPIAVVIWLFYRRRKRRRAAVSSTPEEE